MTRAMSTSFGLVGRWDSPLRPGGPLGRRTWRNTAYCPVARAL